ncbi:MAG: hypothetical protein LBD45_08235 [Bacteroidales bacterium]|jgi:hypothetical protein|nr:hypothetical protein [Bacteroidales bacterium]
MSRLEPQHNPTMYIFECAMAVVYVILAYLLLFTDTFDRGLPKGIRIGLGCIFTAYGVFRIYRALKKGMKRKEDDSN